VCHGEKYANCMYLENFRTIWNKENIVYHYHDTKEAIDEYNRECFDLTLSDLMDNLDYESADFKAWILGNPEIGDTYVGMGNDVASVVRIS